MKNHLHTLFGVGACALLLVPLGVSAGPGLQVREAPTMDDEAVLAGTDFIDAPLEGYRSRLLERAFQAASSFPLVPHIKNRSKAQEEVVLAWIELGQERRALDASADIRDWRRGSCLAELAFQRARRGELGRIEELLAGAEEVAYTSDDALMQDWRRERILAKIAKTHALLGREKDLARLDQWVGDGERSEVGAIVSRQTSPEELEQRLAGLDTLAAGGSFDHLSYALASCVALFDRFFTRTDLRDRIEASLERFGSKLPIQMRIEALWQLTESALRHEDRPKALELIERSATLIDGSAWLPEDHVSFVARLAALRHRAGESERARREVDRAVGLFEEGRNRIETMYRAGALRAVGEAYEVLGDRRAALRTLEMALEEGLVNPNSRPRAFDFVALTCLLARLGIEPGKEFSERIDRVLAKELREPW